MPWGRRSAGPVPRSRLLQSAFHSRLCGEYAPELSRGSDGTGRAERRETHVRNARARSLEPRPHDRLDRSCLPCRWRPRDPGADSDGDLATGARVRARSAAAHQERAGRVRGAPRRGSRAARAVAAADRRHRAGLPRNVEQHDGELHRRPRDGHSAHRRLEVDDRGDGDVEPFGVDDRRHRRRPGGLRLRAHLGADRRRRRVHDDGQGERRGDRARRRARRRGGVPRRPRGQGGARGDARRLQARGHAS